METTIVVVMVIFLAVGNTALSRNRIENTYTARSLTSPLMDTAAISSSHQRSGSTRRSGRHTLPGYGCQNPLCRCQQPHRALPHGQFLNGAPNLPSLAGLSLLLNPTSGSPVLPGLQEGAMDTNATIWYALINTSLWTA
jgi:hypothetical protein